MTNVEKLIKKRVQKYYRVDDYNCVRATLLILSEYFDIELDNQVLSCAVGMHGAGCYGAQCGLVEGGLMFLGILGREYDIPEDTIIEACNNYARQFENKFGSLKCSILRPEGFHDNNPPNICEPFSFKAVKLSLDHALALKKKSKKN